MAVDKQVKGFKRINFFKGFLTTEHDWNAAELYHVEKRKLHNKLLHAPGVALQRPDSPPGLGIPQADVLVVAPAGQERAIGAEGHGQHGVAMTFERTDQAT